MEDHKPVAQSATLDDAAFLLAHFARSNAAPVDCLTDEGVAAREARSRAFEDAAHHCRALLAGDPRSMRMLARLRQEAAGLPPRFLDFYLASEEMPKAQVGESVTIRREAGGRNKARRNSPQEGGDGQ